MFIALYIIGIIISYWGNSRIIRNEERNNYSWWSVIFILFISTTCPYISLLVIFVVYDPDYMIKSFVKKIIKNFPHKPPTWL